VAHLPPDLSRLGDDLQAAAERSLDARRRRADRARRPGVAMVAALIFAALTPAALGPADRFPALVVVDAAETFPPPPCDRPSGASFRPACLTAGPSNDRIRLHRIAAPH
jgi:hypothetical protein